MAVRAPFSLIVAMIMAFSVSPKMASVYLIAVIILGIILAFITGGAFKYFSQVFKKYDELNESVQENVTAHACRKGICKRRLREKEIQQGKL